jgi:hypothetical protein
MKKFAASIVTVKGLLEEYSTCSYQPANSSMQDGEVEILHPP